MKDKGQLSSLGNLMDDPHTLTQRNQSQIMLDGTSNIDIGDESIMQINQSEFDPVQTRKKSKAADS